ncbi:hypothetical protein D3C84_766360 [compost metagenome]
MGKCLDFSLTLLFGLLLRKHLTQELLQFAPLGDLRGFAAARIDQAAEHWRVLKGLVHPVKGYGQVLFASLAAEVFPLVASGGDGQAAAGQMHFRKAAVTTGIRVAPSFQRHSKGRQLHTALIQLQAMQVSAEHPVDSLLGCDVLGLHAHGHQH